MTTAYAVTGVLDRRHDLEEQRLFRRCCAVAFSVHALALAAAWFVPRWTREAPPPIEYVAIQIVPAARLGVEKPPPVAEAPKPEPVPEPTPPPEPVEEPVAKPVEPPKPADPRPSPPTPATRPVTRPAAAKPAPSPAAPAAPPAVQGSERGAASGLALGASVAGLDNPDFTYGYYVDQMLLLIQGNWTRPMIGSGVEVTVYYRIGRDGKIVESRIARSSGINSFDLAALRAVQASSPLPPLPRAYRESWLGVHLIFR